MMISLKILRLAMIVLTVVAGSQSAVAKRAAPKMVPGLIHGNVKYIAPDVLPDRESIYGKSTCSREGSCVEARSRRNGKLLWKVEVYKTKIDPQMETDVQYVYITSLKIEGSNLIVKNEAGEVFMVDLKTHVVTKRW
jgi:hypothetical protein